MTTERRPGALNWLRRAGLFVAGALTGAAATRLFRGTPVVPPPIPVAPPPRTVVSPQPSGPPPEAVPPPMPNPYAVESENYLTGETSLRSWLLTTDHKRIALLYMATITLFFAVGGVAATFMRLQLTTPNGHLVGAETYNKLFTIHGVIMVWFFLLPAVPTVLGNFLLPLMIGARDLAFPKLNLLSWYIFILGGAITGWMVVSGGVDTGWTMYTPLSTRNVNSNVTMTAIGVFIAGFSTILTGLNFIVTTHKLRAPGMYWNRLPIFVWTLYATSIIMVMATPVLTITLALLSIERIFHIGVFDPALGGDPLLFQHLFWFYSHPAVYIMILPGMGIVSEIITCFARKPIFSYQWIVWATIGIAVFGFLVWGHHMFVAGQSMYGGMVFSLLSYLVAIPSAIKVFNWTATLYKGSIDLKTPLLYALSFIGLFTVGGLSGLFLAALGVDVPLHDTYFVIAHFHFIMVGGMVSAYLGGVHYWWPKITGRMYSDRWGSLSAMGIFFGFVLTFLPQFVLGRLGMPRRYYHYPEEFQILNIMSTAGASILAVGYLLPFLYLVWSLKNGPRAARNPWRATGLEWQTSSPPTTDNFDHQPVVTQAPYQYSPDETEEAVRRGEW